MENAGIFFKNRSYSSCVHEGLKLGIQNFLTLLRNVWPTMLVASLVTAAASLTIGKFLPYLVSFIGKADSTLMLFGIFMLLKLVMLLAGSIYLGHLFLLIRKYHELQFFPILSLKETWPELKGLWGRSFSWLLVFWVISFGSFAIFHYTAGWTWWSFLFDLIILLVFSIPYLFSGVACLFDQTNLKGTWKAYLQAFHTWGGTAAVTLVGGLVALIILFISWLPSCILLAAEVFSYQNMLAGDPIDLPSGFAILKFFVLFFTVVLSGIAMWALVFPLVFHYASVKFRTEEKENMIKENSLDDYTE